MRARLGYTVRKTLWFWLVQGEWSDPRTHWRKYGELEGWMRGQKGA
jgi:hypothetical protein